MLRREAGISLRRTGGIRLLLRRWSSLVTCGSRLPCNLFDAIVDDYVSIDLLVCACRIGGLVVNLPFPYCNGRVMDNLICRASRGELGGLFRLRLRSRRSCVLALRSVCGGSCLRR